MVSGTQSGAYSIVIPGAQSGAQSGAYSLVISSSGAITCEAYKII